MRSLGFSLVLGVTPLLLGVALPEAAAQRARPMRSSHRPIASPVRHELGLFQPRMVLSSSLLTGYSSASQPTSGGYSTYGMPMSYSPYQTTTDGAYDGYSSSSSAPAQIEQLPRRTTADDVEVSGPMDTPPPRRAIVRVRLPHTSADVGFDGRKVDSMGRARTYVTPELSGARTFEVTTTWKNNGRTVWLMEQVTVKAGQIRTLDFTSGN